MSYRLSIMVVILRILNYTHPHIQFWPILQQQHRMLPIYKLLSLFLRVFSRPLINLTKRYHANNQIKNDWVKRQFFGLGGWFHRTQTKIQKRYLKIQTDHITVRQISESAAIERGIEFFYEILFYCIAIGMPTYEMYRMARDGREKDGRLSVRVEGLCGQMESLSIGGLEVLEALAGSQYQFRHLSMVMNTKYLLFCTYTVNEEMNQLQFIMKKHSKMARDKTNSKRYLYC